MRRPAGLRSLRWLLAVGLALPPMVAGVAVVLAYWTAHGSGSAPASSGVLAVPAGVTATATSTRGTVTVSWSGEVGPDGATITRYRVQRIAGTVASDACGTTATSTLTAPPTSCTDTAVPDGTYTYAVTAVYHSWTATGVAGSAATVLPHAPTSVSLANGGGAGAAYVDGANAASVAVDVALNSTSLAADTVSLTLHDAGSAHTLTRTAAATAGSGTVHFTGLDLSGFADGTITASASVTDTIGGASGAVTATPTKDTVAPAAPTSVSISNSLGAGSAYINSTNAGSVGYAVVLPNNTNDSATDTIKVTLTSGATVSGSLASGLSSSGGTIAISALNATGLTDGSVAVSATATDLAGNISTATTTTTTKDTVAPATPTSVSLTNGLGSGSAYIDGTNRAAVNYNVVLPNSVNDQATDTVKVALTSGGSVSGSVTSGLSSAGGTVAVNGVNTTSLTDGSVSVSATATDLAGNVSAAATTTTTKDTVAPAAPTSVSIGNGLGSGSAYINSTNAASVNYSVVLPNNANASATDTIRVTLTSVASVSGSIASGLTSAGGTVSVTAINAGSLTDGSVSVSATATDVAGNASTAATTTTSKDTVAPAAPTSVAISNGLGSGSSYISGANKAAVNYNVVLPSNANDSATDTIKVTLTGGASVSGSIASGLGAGGGTVGVTAINATSLTDGSVAVSATATDVAGNVSSA
ncbi:MAG TPA: hypothetical protein VH134_01170, partial [Candidatus Dormibacteraeota bacterium]|nr:hypothetical protein [Candidatus Dormibacteraeota bacterium]